MRRTTTLTVLSGLAGLALAPVVGSAPAQAAQSCDGRAATIVAAPSTTFPPVAVQGTPGDDVIVGTGGDDVIHGNGGHDTVCGLAGRDELFGGEGDDRLFGGLDGTYYPDDDYFGDRLVPGPGNDLVDLGHDPQSQDLWWGDTGHWDVVSYVDAAGPVVVDLAAGTATGEGTDTIAPITWAGGVEGSPHGDTLRGQAGPDWITAGGGADTVEGRAGDDQLEPDLLAYPLYDPPLLPGDDVADGGEGADTVVGGHGADVLTGGAGNDRMRVEAGTGSRADGDAGRDELDGSGDARLDGGAGRDVLWPIVRDSGVVHAVGGDGRDTLRLDVARGGEKSSLVIGKPAGTVRLAGGTGVRFASVPVFELNSVRQARVTWWGTPGRDVAELENATRSVRAFGRGGDDRIRGSWGADLLDGGPGRDRLDGNTGRDRCVRGERLSDCEVRR